MTDTPTYKVTSWFDIQEAADRDETEVPMRYPLPRATLPNGREMAGFLLSFTVLTTDDLNRELDKWVRKEHAEWETRELPYTGLIGHGDGWWHCAGAQLWYRVRQVKRT